MVDKAAASKAKTAGNAAFKAKEYEKALEFYNTAIQKDPTEVRINKPKTIGDHPYPQASYFSNRANIFLFLERYEESEKDATKAIEMDPKNANAKVMLKEVKIIKKERILCKKSIKHYIYPK